MKTLTANMFCHAPSNGLVELMYRYQLNHDRSLEHARYLQNLRERILENMARYRNLEYYRDPHSIDLMDNFSRGYMLSENCILESAFSDYRHNLQIIMKGSIELQKHLNRLRCDISEQIHDREPVNCNEENQIDYKI